MIDNLPAARMRSSLAPLGLPDRMLAALQINLRGTRLPSAVSDRLHYLKIPLDRFGSERPST